MPLLNIYVKIFNRLIWYPERFLAIMLPLFTSEGVLPSGDYALTLDELRVSHLVTGAGNPSPTWDSIWRLQLVDNLEVLVEQLWAVGIEHIFANGSFVENKDHPRDIDGYFECDLKFHLSGALERELNARDADEIWTWRLTSRQAHPDSVKRELPMWHRYRVELYPHTIGQLSGVRDQFGNDLQFPSAFRQTRRTFKPKGIVQIVRESQTLAQGPKESS